MPTAPDPLPPPFAPPTPSGAAEARAHLERAARHASRPPSGVEPDAVASAAVLGFGTMGRGISLAFAAAGVPVSVFETSDAAWTAGRESVAGSLARAVSRERIDQPEADRRLERIGRASSLEAAAASDFVVEAVFEDLDVKTGLFARLGAVAPESSVLATNTSSLDVNRIAEASGRPESVVGAHFFSPAHVMRLLEVVVGDRTAPRTLATTLALGTRLGKAPVPVGVCDGFVGNRMLYAYRRAADELLLEGALPHEVDGALKRFGFRMGPYEVADLAGLDIGRAVRRRQAREAVRRGEPEPPPTVADDLVALGRLGQKTGAGFYRYAPGSRDALPDPEVNRLVEEASRARGVARRAVTASEILERALTALITEGRRILDEGIARHPSHIDLIWVLGYGFPAGHGGPLHWAATHGR